MLVPTPALTNKPQELQL